MLAVKKALIFCGMPGSGKSIGATVAKDLGIPVFVMGDVVREEVTRRQLPHTPQSLGQVMVELREEFGSDVIAKRTIQQLSNISESSVVIDGARSESEVKAFQEAMIQVIVVAVHASPSVRFERLRQRGRKDDALTKEIFLDRDCRELDIGLGRLIAQADIMIVNEGKYEKLQSQIRQVLTQILGLE